MTGLATGIAAQAAQTYTAAPSLAKTTLNGSPVTIPAYKINDSSLNAINMYTQKAYTPVGAEGAATGTEEKQAKDTTSAIYVNGQDAPANAKGYDMSYAMSESSLNGITVN